MYWCERGRTHCFTLIADVYALCWGSLNETNLLTAHVCLQWVVRDHTFLPNSYFTSTQCHLCSNNIWGIGVQGYQCSGTQSTITMKPVSLLQTLESLTPLEQLPRFAVTYHSSCPFGATTGHYRGRLSDPEFPRRGQTTTQSSQLPTFIALHTAWQPLDK